MPRTPTPYRFEYRNWRNEPSEHAHIRGGEYTDEEDGTRVSTAVAVVLGNPTSEPVTRDTAAFICRACNAHDALVAACRAAQGDIHALEHVAACVDDGMSPELKRLRTIEAMIANALALAEPPTQE